jgi:putative membrane protein
MILILKAVHIIAVISWMAGLLYLPRLFVYHAEAGTGSPIAETFKTMQHRLLRFIMRPAMIAVWVTGPWLAWEMGVHRDRWLWAKLLLVILLTIAHEQMQRWHAGFVADNNPHSARFYRVVNEVPTVLMILIILLVVLKPF